MARIEDELVMQFKSEQQKAFLNILFTANWIKHKDTARLSPFGLSAQQYNILRILRGAKGKKMSMHQVLERMLDRAPNATRLADKLIAKQLVVRERCEEDRRVVYISISPQGLELLATIDKGVDQSLVELAKRLTPEEAEAINRGLDKMRD
jgi:MarR family transcriptional regulator, 2-MHQ and catechol-resistance regulon repressor